MLANAPTLAGNLYLDKCDKNVFILMGTHVNFAIYDHAFGDQNNIVA